MTRAWELVNDPEFCSKLTVVGLRDLMVRAGYPAEVVREAVLRHGNQRLDADMVM